MGGRRITPDIEVGDSGDGGAFFGDLLGLDTVMDLGWIVTYASASNPAVQINVVRVADGTPATDYSVEVEDVDLVHARACAAGLAIVYPLRTEPCGVRRFFVRDPFGKIANILSHLG